MSRRPKSITWHADPHTVAKVEIVRKYLFRWAYITGTTFSGVPLTYIDGFAGPGEYSNFSEGSPIAALKAMNDAKAKGESEGRWKASNIRALFVEQDPRRKEHLEHLINDGAFSGNVKWIARASTFVEGLDYAQGTLAKAFFTSAPLVVFIDPFGATGFPWSAIERILSSRTSEIILNFDADGMARIASAGVDSNADQIMDTIFGSSEWRDALEGITDMRAKEVALVDLYKRKLRSLPNVKYTFAFEMASTTSGIDYFLLFASQSSVGLKKMKEAMKEIDQTGTFRFSDAEVQQQRLFKFDTPSDWVQPFVDRFSGKEISLDEALTFILNETPFYTVAKLLGEIERRGLLHVESTNLKRRKGTFPEDTITRLRIGGGVLA